MKPSDIIKQKAREIATKAKRVNVERPHLWQALMEFLDYRYDEGHVNIIVQDVPKKKRGRKPKKI